jgi:hypothetical protein
MDLADQYKVMDATSNAIKRNIVADQLVEVVQLLQRKGNHIAALYDCQQFHDKPIAEHGWVVGPDNLLRPRRR